MLASSWSTLQAHPAQCFLAPWATTALEAAWLGPTAGMEQRPGVGPMAISLFLANVGLHAGDLNAVALLMSHPHLEDITPLTRLILPCYSEWSFQGDQTTVL